VEPSDKRAWFYLACLVATATMPDPKRKSMVLHGHYVAMLSVLPYRTDISGPDIIIFSII
jgi:hypothetical protein